VRFGACRGAAVKIALLPGDGIGQEIIGEAAKHVSEDFRTQHPTVEWRAMAGLRDRLIHDYFGVDFELVWDVVHRRIPELRTQIAAILES